MAVTIQRSALGGVMKEFRTIAIACLMLVCTMAPGILLKTFNKVVTLAATPECIVASGSTLRSPDVTIQALSTNVNGVWVGDSSVTSSGPGMRIVAGQAVSLSNIVKQGTAQHFTLKDICLAVESDGEGVSVAYTVVNP